MNIQEYQIVFTTGAGKVHVWALDCASEVDVQQAGGLKDYTDAKHALLDAVRRVLPAAATATQHQHHW